MKISRFNLRILEDELKSLEELFPDVRKAIKSWSEPAYNDAEWVAIQRNKLEKELTAFREKLSTIYDFMGDRGLADFVPTRIRNEREAQKEPFPEETEETEENHQPRKIGDMVMTYGDEA